MMFSYGAPGPTVRAAEKRELLDKRSRPVFALFAGFVITGTMPWFPLSAWFSGVTYLPPFPIFQAAIMVGLPMLVTGMLAARIGRSLWTAPTARVISLLAFPGAFFTFSCPACATSLA